MKWLICLVLSGCGASFDGGFSGWSSGDRNNAPFGNNVSVVLKQSGKNVVGTWSGTDQPNGSLSGTVDGTTLTFEVVQDAAEQCTGKMSGIAILGTNLVGNLSGTLSEPCKVVKVSFSLSRVN